MRKDITVEAEIRNERGKNEARRLRQRGRIPAVLYGAYKEPVSLSVDPGEVTRILHSPTGHNTIFQLNVREGESTLAMIVDWQYHPVTDRLLHVDFKRIDPSRKIRVSVPVVTQGDPRGVKEQGGLLEIVTREIEIECLPDEIPEHFTVDVTPLWIGQNIRAGDIPMSGSMRLLSSPDAVIAHVIALRGATTAAPEEAAQAPAAAEPEVIKKGKKEEEEGEGKKK
ncbi:MAG: 50S ribosomal protein L25 [Bryobacteraceae bacterium]